MNKKPPKLRNKELAIKGEPKYGQRVEKPKKGKGSYSRTNKNPLDE